MSGSGLLAERTRLIGAALRHGAPDGVTTVTWGDDDWGDAGAACAAAASPLPQVTAVGWGDVVRTLLGHDFHCCPARIAANTLHLPGDSDSTRFTVSAYVELVLLWMEAGVEAPDDPWGAFIARVDMLSWGSDPYDLLFTTQNAGLDAIVGRRSDLSGDSRWAFEDLDLRSSPDSLQKRDSHE